MSGPGLLLVRSKPPENFVGEFNRWYDNEHVPLRTALPGWLTARRYVSTSDPTDFMACYDLMDLGVLSDSAYVKVRQNRSFRERRVIATLRYLDRRVYRTLSRIRTGDSRPTDDLRHCGPLLLCVWWQPSPTSVNAFHEWYEGEHLPLLAGIPGWDRSRRFQLVEGAGPTYLAMHDLAGEHVFSHPAYQRAMTVMRHSVGAECLSHDQTVYRLLHNFDPSPDRDAVS